MGRGAAEEGDAVGGGRLKCKTTSAPGEEAAATRQWTEGRSVSQDAAWHWAGGQRPADAEVARDALGGPCAFSSMSGLQDLELDQSGCRRTRVDLDTVGDEHMG